MTPYAEPITTPVKPTRGQKAVVWLDRAKKQAVCQCGRPGCPGQFTSEFGRVRADKACDAYYEAEWRREYYARTKAPAVARRKYEHEERTKLPGDRYCSPCGRYTDTFEFRGDAVCKECGEER